MGSALERAATRVESGGKQKRQLTVWLQVRHGRRAELDRQAAGLRQEKGAGSVSRCGVSVPCDVRGALLRRITLREVALRSETVWCNLAPLRNVDMRCGVWLRGVVCMCEMAWRSLAVSRIVTAWRAVVAWRSVVMRRSVAAWCSVVMCPCNVPLLLCSVGDAPARSRSCVASDKPRRDAACNGLSKGR